MRRRAESNDLVTVHSTVMRSAAATSRAESRNLRVEQRRVTSIPAFLKDDGSIIEIGDLVRLLPCTRSVWRIHDLEVNYPNVDVICRWPEHGEIGDPHLAALYNKNGQIRVGPNWVRKLSPLELLALESL